MVLPQTLSGAQFSDIYNARPIRNANGDHYIVALNVFRELEVWKSDNGDVAWSIQDAFANPLRDDIVTVAAKMDTNGVIHIITAKDNLNTDYDYHTFLTSTDGTNPDEWDITLEAIVSNVDTDVASTAVIGMNFVIRSDGSIVCIFQSNSDKNMGTDYTRIDYIIRSSGSWGSPVAVDDGGLISYTNPVAVSGESDLVHFHYAAGSTGSHKSLTSGGTLSSVQSAGSGSEYNHLAYYDNGGDEEIWGVYQNGATTISEWNVINDGTPAFVGNIISSSTVNGVEFAINTATGNRYTLKLDSSDDIILFEESGAGWDAGTNILSATVNRIFANIYENDSEDTVLAYSYLDGSTLKYNEYVIAVGSTATVELDADIISTHSGSGSLDVAKALDTDISSSHSGTASLSIEHNLDTDITATHSGTASLSVDKALDATVSGVHSGTASLELIKALSADLTGNHSGTAQLNVPIRLDADISGTHTGTASLELIKTLEADVSATHTGDASLAIERNLDTTITGSHAGSANLERIVSFEATISGVHAGSASLAVTKTLSADITASHAGSAELDTTQLIDLSADILDTYSGTADLNVIKAFDASISASHNGSANLAIERELSATISGSYTGSASLDVVKTLETDISGSHIDSALLDVVKTLSADMTGEHAGSANLEVDTTIELSATLSGTYTGTANLSVTQNLSATLSGVHTDNTDLTVTKALDVDMSGVHAGPAEIEVVKALSSSMTGTHVGSAELDTDGGNRLVIYLADANHIHLFNATTSITSTKRASVDATVNLFQASAHTIQFKTANTTVIQLYSAQWESYIMTVLQDNHLSVRINYTEEDGSTTADPTVIIFNLRHYTEDTPQIFTYDNGDVENQASEITKEGAGQYVASVEVTKEGTYYWEFLADFAGYKRSDIGEEEVVLPKARATS